MNLTFIIPTKLESKDRIRNLTTVLINLLSKFDAKIRVLECDFSPKFDTFVLPYLIDKFGKIPSNFHYEYEEQKTTFFHKTRILNDLIQQSNTEIICNYDTDVLFPDSSINDAYELIISNQSDAVYPYGCGVYQKSIKYSDETFNWFINSNLDVNLLNSFSTLNNSTIGWCQIIRKKNYIDSFMMNENFKAWGPEDCELYYRLNVFGNRVDRINDYVYHLEHVRSNDSWFSNPMWQDNTNLWNWIRLQPKNTLINYYKNQEYIKVRNNVSI